MPPRNVLFFLSTLGGGGAEAHTLRLLNHLDRSRWRPSLAVAKLGGNFEKFLAPDVSVVGVSFARVSSSVGRMALAVPGLRRLVMSSRRDRPFDVVCAVMETGSLAAIGALATIPARARPRLLLCVQVPPLEQYGQSALGRRVILPGIRHAFPRADRIVALSRGVKGELARIQPRLEPMTTVIHNACVDERILAASHPDGGGPRSPMPSTDLPVVVTAGRLSREKNYVHLVDAFARVRTQLPAELWILGEGPERPALEARIREHALGESVRLLGFRPDPQTFMRRATVFVLSSLYEGFGNVIVEALACGAPVVATDCPYGPAEILTHERDGLLVPVGDRDALAAAILRVLRDGELRRRLAQAGPVRAGAFHAAPIAAAYADELDRVLRDASAPAPTR